jgi:hypothetical protein
MNNEDNVFYSQIIPLTIAFLTGAIFFVLLLLNINLLNFIFPRDPVRIVFGITDLLLGFYLYLKTSIDFAVFIGSMMVSNPGWKNRVAVEWGTSLGNFVGTIAIIWIWVVFRATNPIFEAIIVIIASFILLELAAGSLSKLNPRSLFYKTMTKILLIRKFTIPFVSWMPDIKGTMNGKKAPNFRALLLYSFTIPFVLGSDDFAGYISVFNVVNIFPFAVGVIAGHTLLLASIFAAPKTTEKIMAMPAFSGLAVVTFIAIFGFGFYEGIKILFVHNPLFLAIAATIILLSPNHHLIKTGWEKTREQALRLLRAK